VTVEVEAERATIPLDRAIPAGLVVNELVTSSFKYAFGNGGGRLKVRFATRSHQSEACITVEDDGSGLDLPPQKGLGLTLVEGFAQQIQGQVEYVRVETGCKIVFRFPVNIAQMLLSEPLRAKSGQQAAVRDIACQRTLKVYSRSGNSRISEMNDSCACRPACRSRSKCGRSHWAACAACETSITSSNITGCFPPRPRCRAASGAQASDARTPGPICNLDTLREMIAQNATLPPGKGSANGGRKSSSEDAAANAAAPLK
jgi:anti-sigma regulatory factor (Ser/Thr protein kinase)